MSYLAGNNFVFGFQDLKVLIERSRTPFVIPLD